MTMVPSTLRRVRQMLRPAWSSWRSCEPNGLISPNVRQLQLSSRHVWPLVSSGRFSAKRLTSVSDAVVELDGRRHAVALERGALPHQERAVGRRTLPGRRRRHRHRGFELRLAACRYLALRGLEPHSEILALRQHLGPERGFDRPLPARLRGRRRATGTSRRRAPAARRTRRSADSPATRGGAARGPGARGTPRAATAATIKQRFDPRQAARIPFHAITQTTATGSAHAASSTRFTRTSRWPNRQRASSSRSRSTSSQANAA